MTLDEIENLKRRLLEQYKADVEAINHVAELMARNPSGAGDKMATLIESTPGVPLPKPRQLNQKSFNLAAIVRAAVEKCPNRIKVDEVEKIIRDSYPELAGTIERKKILYVLWRIAKNDQIKQAESGIKQAETGQGRRATIYEKYVNDLRKIK